MTSFRYKAFISYAHADEKWAAWLHRSIETYRVPKPVVAAHGLGTNRLFPVFRDRDELGSSSHLSEAIEEALAQSEFLIVICSPAAAASKWVNKEIEVFRSLGRGSHVLCLLLGAPDASFPPAIRGADEPLAADARETADGRATAKLKIIAGLLGINLGELAQRETQRRIARITYVAAASVVGMAFAIGLSVITYLAQQETERQRLIALEQKLAAENEVLRTQAINGFLQKILQASDTQSGGIASDVTLNEVLNDARKTVAEQFSNQPDIRAEILHTLGTSYLHRADYKLAREVLREAHDIRIELLGENNPDTASAANTLGRLYHETGALDESEVMFRRAIKNVRGLADHEALLGAALNNLGILLRDRGRMDEAERTFREALQIKQALFGEIHTEVTPTLNNLGLLLADRGQFAEARSLFSTAVAANRELWGEAHSLVGINLNNLAWIHLDLQEPLMAEKVFDEALAIKRAANGDDHPSTAISLSGLGVAMEQQGRIDAALEAHGNALRVFERAYEPGHWRIHYTRALFGRALGKAGRPTEAQATLEQSVARLLEVLGPDHRRTQEAQRALDALDQ